MRVEIDEAIRAASVETLARIRRDWEEFPEQFAPLLACIEKHLFTAGFGAQQARSLACLGSVDPPLGQALKAYLDEQRIRTVAAILERSGGRVPTGRAALAVGVGSYLTYRRAYRHLNGEYPVLVRLPVFLTPRFDPVNWHRACRGDLGQAGRALGRRLCRLYPSAFAGGAPGAELLAAGEAASATGYGLTERQAQQALECAAEESLRRLRRDAEGLPPELARALQVVAERLFDPDLSVEEVRQRAGVRDTGLTTKVRFFVGDTLADIIERRRVETAVALLGDRRFTIERIAEAVGMSYRRLCRVFQRRTGARPSEVRQTTRATSGHAACSLWRRAESGELSVTEARQLGSHLRALCPNALQEIEPATLTVRTDIDPGRVAEVIRLSAAVAREARATLDQVLRTHPGYSAAHWYSHWIHARLGRGTLDSAWAVWQAADRALRSLLELPADQRAERVRQDPAYHGDAFFWLLVDCVSVRLFQDAAESEHFVDLALVVAEARCSGETSPEASGRRGLALALKGNAIRRKGELAEAARRFEQGLMAIQAGNVEPWIEGRLHSLHGQLLHQQGNSHQARRSLFFAAALMKRAGDGLERLRVVVARAPTWLATGLEPSRLLTRCIEALRQYPFAADLLQSAHVTRLLARLYLADQLTGTFLAEICSLRAVLPPATSPFLTANHQKIDGLIAVLNGKPATGGRILRQAAQWYEEQGFLGDAAVCWLQYAWAVLEVDSDNARQAALVSYEYLAQSGFDEHSQRRIAQQIYFEARCRSLKRETLRLGILVRVCPSIETRLAYQANRISID